MINMSHILTLSLTEYNVLKKFKPTIENRFKCKINVPQIDSSDCCSSNDIIVINIDGEKDIVNCVKRFLKSQLKPKKTQRSKRRKRNIPFICLDSDSEAELEKMNKSKQKKNYQDLLLTYTRASLTEKVLSKKEKWLKRRDGNAPIICLDSESDIEHGINVLPEYETNISMQGETDTDILVTNSDASLTDNFLSTTNEFKESIMKANWPIAAPVDNVLLKASSYFMDTVHKFRIRMKNLKGKKNTPVTKPTTAIIWIAKTFPPWQTLVLQTLQNLYKENQGLPDNKIIAAQLGKLSELKKYMKKVMPFVQVMKEKAESAGVSAFNLFLDFDEFDVLNKNLDYLINTLDLENITLKYTDENDECCPGDPIIVYSHDPLMKVQLINQECHNGYFEVELPVFDGLTIGNLITKTSKNQRIPGSKKVTLYRYEEPTSGPRTIPVLGQTQNGKIPVQLDAKFSIENSSVYIEENGKKYQIGYQMAYVVA